MNPKHGTDIPSRLHLMPNEKPTSFYRCEISICNLWNETFKYLLETKKKKKQKSYIFCFFSLHVRNEKRKTVTDMSLM